MAEVVPGGESGPCLPFMEPDVDELAAVLIETHNLESVCEATVDIGSETSVDGLYERAMIEVKADCDTMSMIYRFLEVWQEWGISPEQQVDWIDSVFGSEHLEECNLYWFHIYASSTSGPEDLTATVSNAMFERSQRAAERGRTATRGEDLVEGVFNKD